jgi:hypothetical protein
MRIPFSNAASVTRGAPASYTLSSLGLEWQSECSLRRVLDLLPETSRARWAYVNDVAAADAVIYEPGNALAQAVVRRADGQRQIFIACGQHPDDALLSLPIPVGPTRLMAVLEVAAERLGGTVVNQSSLCERLDDALQCAETAGLSVTVDDETGYISIQHRGVYWPRPLSAMELTSVLLDRARFARIPAESSDWARRIEPLVPQMLNWDAVMWAIGVHTSMGSLLSRLEPCAAYRLSRWPDFGVIGRRSAEMKCAALLSQRALSPAGLAAISGLPQTTVNNFFNACALCGLLKVDQTTAARDPAPERKTAQRTSVLSGVLQRLRQALALDGGRA